MQARVEQLFNWSIFLSAILFVLSTIGIGGTVIAWAPWLLLILAAVIAGWIGLQTGKLNIASNRLRRYGIGWTIGAGVMLVLWALSRKDVQAALPFLKAGKKALKSFAQFAPYFAALFIIFALVLLVVGTRDSGRDKPGQIERTFSGNLSAKLAGMPMAFTSLGVFVIGTLWTVYHSFTNSKLLPNEHWIGFAQYVRLWGAERWIVSIGNLAIYGICSMILSLVIGFFLAALLDQKIRFENVFRTIFLFPFALSFIVTGLVWQWILTPQFGIQHIVRSLGWENFTFDPLYNADIVIYGILIAGLWQGTGLIMVIMLSGLRGIDQEIWKASKIDGIPTWKTYLFVVIPMMRPVFVTTLVLIATGIIKLYDLVVAQTSGGPGLASEVPAKYVYDYMFGGQNLAQGFAASTMMLVSVLILLIPMVLLQFGGRKSNG